MSEEIKFRACISPNTIIYFNLKDLMCCDEHVLINNDYVQFPERFSIKLIKEWFRRGGVPDRYAGFKALDETEIYERDLIQCDSINNKGGRNIIIKWTACVEFKDGEFSPRPHKHECEAIFYEQEYKNFVVIGNCNFEKDMLGIKLGIQN